MGQRAGYCKENSAVSGREKRNSMKKRWMSAALAFALLVVPDGILPAKKVIAEETFEVQTAASVEDSGGETINTPEVIAKAAQENRAGMADGTPDLMQESSVNTSEDAAQADANDDAVSGASESGDFATTDQTDLAAESDAEPVSSGIQIESIEAETEVIDLMDDTEAYTETADGGHGELYASGRIADAGNSDMALYARTVFGTSYGEQLTGNAAEIYQQMEQALTKNGCKAFTCTLPSPLTFPVYPTETSGGKLNWHIDSNEQYQNAVINAVNQSAQSAYDAFTYDHPELFWLGKMSYEWKITFRREAGADNGTGTIRDHIYTNGRIHGRGI